MKRVCRPWGRDAGLRVSEQQMKLHVASPAFKNQSTTAVFHTEDRSLPNARVFQNWR